MGQGGGGDSEAHGLLFNPFLIAFQILYACVCDVCVKAFVHVCICVDLGGQGPYLMPFTVTLILFMLMRSGLSLSPELTNWLTWLAGSLWGFSSLYAPP